MKKKFNAGFAVVVTAMALLAQPAPKNVAEADTALQNGEADRALGLLNTLPPTAQTHNLRCRVLFALEHWDAAVGECEQAVTMDPQNSGYHMWLGRALGERASRASFLSAFSLANRVRTEFVQAVQLDPQNAPALADLGEFYYNAPGIIGGGSDKAQAIAAQLDNVDPARADELRGRIAEKQHDYTTAESDLKKAIAVSKHPAFQWMVLASFYTRSSRWNDMDAAVQNGMKAEQQDRSANVALFNAASMLNRCGRDLPLAVQFFQEYLANSAKTEEGPAFVAHTRLAHVEARLGNIPGAQQERAAALELAHDYQPALDLKF